MCSLKLCFIFLISIFKGFPYLKKRPSFGPRQIRTLKGLHVGQKVITFCEGEGVGDLLEIVAFEKDDFIEVNKINSEGYCRFQDEISLADHNVIPYDIHSKKWNPRCCLLRTKAKTSIGLRKTKQKCLIEKDRK